MLKKYLVFLYKSLILRLLNNKKVFIDLGVFNMYKVGCLELKFGSFVKYGVNSNIHSHWKRYVESDKVLNYGIARFERLPSVLSVKGKLENIIGIESFGLTIEKNR